MWCRMQGFPYWPARVDLPAVIDRDIHRLRAEARRSSGQIFDEDDEDPEYDAPWVQVTGCHCRCHCHCHCHCDQDQGPLPLLL